MTTRFAIGGITTTTQNDDHTVICVPKPSSK